MRARLEEGLTSTAIRLAEGGRLPDPVVSAGIRRMLRRRIDGLGPDSVVEPPPTDRIAIETEAANRQHYEVPPGFFQLVLGSHLKYSCCLWEGADGSLDLAEERMLEMTAERAGIADGQDVLDLGCGWGSFSLYAASRYPASRFLAVSNSRPQVEFIAREAASRGLGNLQTQLADVNSFEPGRLFDRVVSVEMMEHVRNHRELLSRVSRWLHENGRLFVHVFCHRDHEYAFEENSSGDWMAREFFSGGMMPSVNTIPESATPHFETEMTWEVSGSDYARTASAWLANLDAHRQRLTSILGDAGEPFPERALYRWRLFFLAVRETFGYRGGEEWHVAHYRLRKEA